MKLSEAKSKVRKTYFINTPDLQIETTVDDMNRITQFTCTTKGKTKIFKVSGTGEDAISKAWMELEKFIGNIQTPKR